jgi:hypothetical protein
MGSPPSGDWHRWTPRPVAFAQDTADLLVAAGPGRPLSAYRPSPGAWTRLPLTPQLAHQEFVTALLVRGPPTGRTEGDDARHVYLGTTQGAYLRSPGGAADWQPIAVPFLNHTRAVHTPDALMFATFGGGVWKLSRSTVLRPPFDPREILRHLPPSTCPVGRPRPPHPPRPGPARARTRPGASDTTATDGARRNGKQLRLEEPRAAVDRS